MLRARLFVLAMTMLAGCNMSQAELLAEQLFQQRFGTPGICSEPASDEDQKYVTVHCDRDGRSLLVTFRRIDEGLVPIRIVTQDTYTRTVMGYVANQTVLEIDPLGFNDQ